MARARLAAALRRLENDLKELDKVHGPEVESVLRAVVVLRAEIVAALARLGAGGSPPEAPATRRSNVQESESPGSDRPAASGKPVRLDRVRLRHRHRRAGAARCASRTARREPRADAGARRPAKLEAANRTALPRSQADRPAAHEAGQPVPAGRGDVAFAGLRVSEALALRWRVGVARSGEAGRARVLDSQRAPHHRKNVLRAIYAAGDAAGLNPKDKPKVGCHSLRHSCAALLLAARVPVPRVAEILRHGDTRTLLTTYTGLVESQRGELLGDLEAAFGEGRWAAGPWSPVVTSRGTVRARPCTACGPRPLRYAV